MGVKTWANLNSAILTSTTSNISMEGTLVYFFVYIWLGLYFSILKYSLCNNTSLRDYETQYPRGIRYNVSTLFHRMEYCQTLIGVKVSF